MISLIPSLNRIWRQEPAGYQPGLTLDRLTQNLHPYACERLSARQLRLRLQQGLSIDICEQAQGLFMAHIVSHRFCVSGECGWSAPLTMEAIAQGWLRQRGVQFRCRRTHAGTAVLLAALNSYPQIADTLARLDFRRARLIVAAGRWSFEIEHFAASEVVSRIPAGRRYLHLERAQRQHLLSALLMMGQLMEKLNG
ncbi:DUF3156 family protein [Klebsiella variicola]|uniref:DUF3156 family protein n=1 Tax=Klebsiella variicola TaxID=244366 RepID=UPI002B06200E|nr:DUF3156 family protein [Klebsiella variicola]